MVASLQYGTRCPCGYYHITDMESHQQEGAILIDSSQSTSVKAKKLKTIKTEGNSVVNGNKFKDLKTKKDASVKKEAVDEQIKEVVEEDPIGKTVGPPVLSMFHLLFPDKVQRTKAPNQDFVTIPSDYDSSLAVIPIRFDRPSYEEPERFMKHEDHMKSFFLAETVKNLWLLFDLSSGPNNIVENGTYNYVFNTEDQLSWLKSIKEIGNGGQFKHHRS